MKRISPPRRAFDTQPAVSLFPFLAVLLCTMGMLVMILVLVSRKTAGRQIATPPHEALRSETLEGDSAAARSVFRTPSVEKTPIKPLPVAVAEPILWAEISHATAPPEKTPLDHQYEVVRDQFGDASPEEIQAEIERTDWFVEELAGVKQRTGESLTTARARLAETEQETAKLVARLLELNAQAIALQTAEKTESRPDEAAALQTEIQQKTDSILSLQEEVGRLRKSAAAANEQKSYAIIPYKGKSGTFRRPIYIECDTHGIFLMPERVPFRPEDFLLAKYPANPFDAAIRAARQYYIETGGDGAEPYPLLIIRPEAAEKYYAAKAALASWGGDYGYEFIENDFNIEYPTPDPELTRRVEEQIALARARLAVPLATLMAEIERQGLANPMAEESPGESFGGEGVSGIGSGSLGARLGPYAKLDSSGGAIGTGSVANRQRGDENRDFAGSKNPEPLPSYVGAYANPSSGISGAVNNGVGGAIPPGIEAPSFGGTQLGGDTVAPLPAALLYGDEKSAMTSTSNVPLPEMTGDSFPDVAATTSSTGGISGGMPPSSEHSVAATASTVPSGTEYHPAEILPPYVASQITSRPSDDAEKIDPRTMVGNTTYQERSANEAESGSSEGIATRSSMKADTSKSPPKPKTPDDKRAINIAEELRRPQAMAIERPITVVCRADRLILPSQPGLNGGREVVFAGTLTDPAAQKSEEDELLETIVVCVRSWNVAGRNMYWSPWLKVKIESGGEATYQRLTSVMKSQQVRINRVP